MSEIPKDLMEKAREVEDEIQAHSDMSLGFNYERIARALLEERLSRLHEVTDGLAHAHGQGQEDAIRDANAGLIDDMIAPRLETARLEERKRCAEIARGYQWCQKRPHPAVDDACVQITRRIEKGDPA